MATPVLNERAVNKRKKKLKKFWKKRIIVYLCSPFRVRQGNADVAQLARARDL